MVSDGALELVAGARSGWTGLQFRLEQWIRQPGVNWRGVGDHGLRYGDNRLDHERNRLAYEFLGICHDVNPSVTTAIGQGAVIDLDDGASYVIGNRQDGQRSFQGHLFYAAIYTHALLRESDDAP